MHSYNAFLQQDNLKILSLNTIYQWMIHLWYQYNEMRKPHYTDGHERLDVIHDSDTRFLNEYFKAELLSCRWVHLTEEKVNARKSQYDDFPIDQCYKFSKVGSTKPILYYDNHMNTHNSFFASEAISI